MRIPVPGRSGRVSPRRVPFILLAGFAALAAIGSANRASATLEYLVVASEGTAQKANADYVCNGSNDSAQINAAITKLTTSGSTSGTVYLTDGTFYLSAPISLGSNSNIKLIGAGPATELLTQPASGGSTAFDAIDSAGGSNITLEDFAINGDSSADTGYGLSFTGTGSGLSAHRLYISNTALAAANITMSHVSLIDCSISSCLGGGIQINSGAANCEVIGSTISSNGTTATPSGGISCQGAQCRFASNLVYGNTGYGIYLGSETNVGHNSAIDNEIYDNTNNGISTGGSYDDAIVGNDCYANSPAGIEIRDRTDGASGSYDTVVSGNRCYGQSYGLLLDHADSTYAPIDVIAEGNDFSSNSTSGIQRQDVGQNCVLQNNLGDTVQACGTATISGTATSVTVTHGLNSAPSFENIQLTPNSSLGSGTAADSFWVSGVTATTFTITVSTSPGTGNSFSFAWQAQVFTEPTIP